MIIRLKGDEKLKVVNYRKKTQSRKPEIPYGHELSMVLEFYHDNDAAYTEEELSVYTSFQWAMDNDFNFSTDPPVLANNATTTFIISGNTISFTVMTDTADLKTDLANDPIIDYYAEFKAYKPGKTRPGLGPVFEINVSNAVAADGSAVPSASPELYITTAEAYALVQDAPDREFSINGATDWHETQVDADRYYRESRNGGDWSDAIAMVAPADMLVDGDTGDLTEDTSSVLTIAGGTGATIGNVTIQVKAATTSQAGYLSSTDWNTFNGKQDALGFTAVPDTRTINGYALTGNITLDADDLADGATNSIITLVQETNFETAYTHSQVATGNPHSVTASDLSLGNVTNESKATMFADPTFTGIVTIPANFKIGAVTITATAAELNYVAGVTSAIQTQLDGKQTSDASLTSIAGLSFVSDSFIKMTAADTYSVRTIAETKSDLSLNNVTNESKATMHTSPTFTGNATLSTGNLIIGTSGKGIDFSATSDATGKTAEILDDYEEGTWTGALTPVGGSITMNLTGGLYTKIGRAVVATASVSVTSVSSPSGGLTMTGLPFTVINNAAGYSAASLYGDGFETTAVTAIQGFAVKNTTTIILRTFEDGAWANLAAQVKAGTNLNVTFMYMTD